MKLVVTAVIALSSPAFAAKTWNDVADCVVFSGTTIDAPKIEVSAVDGADFVKEVHTAASASVNALVWVRDGMVLEAYRQPLFGGPVFSYTGTEAALPSGASASAERFEDGSLIALQTGLSEPDQGGIASLRCRKVGEQLPASRLAPAVTLRSLPGRLAWVSGGNHPDHKWIELNRRNGATILTVHSDSTYGINRADWVLDLDSTALTITVSVRGDRGQPEVVTSELLPKDVGLYVEALDAMRREVEVLMIGNTSSSYTVAPKPELGEVAYFLRVALRRVAVQADNL